MTEQSEPERAQVLYERTRALDRALQDSERELDEVAVKVRLALADLRRAEGSWASRWQRLTAGLISAPSPTPGGRRPDAIGSTMALLEALDQRLAQRERQAPPPR